MERICVAIFQNFRAVMVRGGKNERFAWGQLAIINEYSQSISARLACPEYDPKVNDASKRLLALDKSRPLRYEKHKYINQQNWKVDPVDYGQVSYA